MTEFWLKKMETYFKRIDFDKDGSITRADFEGMANRVIEKGQLEGTQKDELKQNLTKVGPRFSTTIP